MNYYEIGQRIRRYRKEKGLSQEQLAESVNISVTHMSHIETGNTKLSLPVLVDIATVLQVTADDLLTDMPTGGSAKLLMQLTADCTPVQLDLICEIVRAVKNKITV
ncbi:MAG: helix-turn-helix transcriptional regulator [Oscillospiraceae bacterium]|nr:helix-turn-helix transcriptional regulator [Oscillospiraceae bacterium]